MASLLHRLGRTAFRRWPIFIATWIVVLVAVGSVAAAFSKPMSDAFSIPGIPSEKAADLQSELFPGTQDALDRATVNVVVAAPQGHTLAEPQYRRAVDALVRDLRTVPQLPADVRLANPVDAAASQRQQVLESARRSGTPPDVARANAAALSPLSPDGRVGVISFDLDVDTAADVERSTITDLERVMAQARDRGLVVEANGSGMSGFTEPGGSSELVGIAVALVVLLLTFGSLVAAGLPILTAVFGVAIGITGVTAMTAFMDIGSTTPMLATMIGLAVGIDYTLFILARYRTELHHTEDREQAIGIAVGTAGSAVVFAGLTVLIALAALAVVRIPFLTAMGLAAAGTVAIAVVVAVTLLPAILGFAGDRVLSRRQRKADRDGTHAADLEAASSNRGFAWGRRVVKARGPVLLIGVVLLAALAIPAASMRLALPDDGTAPSGSSKRVAYDLVSEGFGPGFNGRLVMVVHGDDAAGVKAAAQQAAGIAQKTPDVLAVAPGQTSADGRTTILAVIPKSGPSDEATFDLVRDLRSGVASVATSTGAEISLTGVTAIGVDVSDKLSAALPVYLLVVVGLSFVLLALVFRSLLVPLKATVGFLLSVGATFGATVAVFQWGWLKDAIGLDTPGPLVSFLPILLIGILFGLAMDYEVFLVSRMREDFVHGETAREAIVSGVGHGARVVVAAALIMISVFAGFVFVDDAIIKSMGFALAFGVLVDAFVVRLALVPAVMSFFGDRAWWLPRRLDRLLPNVDIEGESLRRRTAA